MYLLFWCAFFLKVEVAYEMMAWSTVGTFRCQPASVIVCILGAAIIQLLQSGVATLVPTNTHSSAVLYACVCCI